MTVPGINRSFLDPTEPDKGRSGFLYLLEGKPGPSVLGTALHNVVEPSISYLLKSKYAEDGGILQYGPNLGSSRFRKEMAKFLSEQYQDEVLAKNIMLTAGASNGLLLVASLLFSRGNTVFVEDPTYFIAIKVLREDLGLNVVAVPTDENGVCTDALEQLLEKHLGGSDFTPSEKHPFSTMIYLVPTYNNPKGTCCVPERCRKLVSLARQYEALLFCDDVYNMLHYDENTTAPPRLLTYDCKSDPDYKGHVVSNGTFSKILGPGIRVGWIEAADRLMEFFFNCGAIGSGGAINHFSSEIMAEALSMGLEQAHIQSLCAQYTSTLQKVFSVLRENLPPSVKFLEMKGGYFIWLELPEECNADEVARIAREEYKLIILPGHRCSPTGSYRNCIRMSFTYLEEPLLLKAIEALCQAINTYLAKLNQK